MEKINRFNVYKIYSLEKNDEILFLECLTKKELGIKNNMEGYEWKTENVAGYPSIGGVARKIVELNKTSENYTRVISTNQPLDKTDGNLEGILLNKSGIEVVSRLSDKQFKKLAREIDKLKKACIKI